jgi:hypothetical protein
VETENNKGEREVWQTQRVGLKKKLAWPSHNKKI